MGEIVGALIASFLLTRLGLWATRKMTSPERLTISHGGALVAAGTLYGFGAADGGPFVWSGYLLYGLPTALWYAVDAARLSRRARQESNA